MSTILIAPDEKTLQEYRLLLVGTENEVPPAHCFTLRSPKPFQGLRIKKVLVARPEAIQYEREHHHAIHAIHRSLAMTADREGYFLVNEDGSIGAGSEAM
jgi:hypothetical protein